MNYTYPQFVASDSADRIIDALTDQQHVRPHQTVPQAVAASALKAGFCLQADQRAVEALMVDAAMVIGRLRRTKSIQVAKLIHHWHCLCINSPRLVDDDKNSRIGLTVENSPC